MPAAARKIVLTDRSLLALKPVPAGKRVTIWDAIQPGLAVRVGARGRPTFFAVRRRAGDPQPTWVLLGTYPTVSLADAREAARSALTALIDGKDPVALKAAKRLAEAEAEREAADNTFAAVAERFNDWYRATPGKGRTLRRTASGVAATIARELTPVWGERPIADITKRDVTRVVQAILARAPRPEPGKRRRQSGGPYAARATFAAARLIFGWAHRPAQGLIPTDPTADLDPIDLHGAPMTRERVLEDDELRRVWLAAEATPYPYGPLVRLLILTGARLREVAEAKWTEVDLEAAELTVPASRMKMNKSHLIPLTSAAAAIVRDLPRFEGGDYLFTTTGGRRPISGFSKYRAKFNETLGDIDHFVIHDLRRTCRTGMSSLRVLLEIRERVIGHLPGGIVATYDHHDFKEEKREALEKWEGKVMGIVATEPEPTPSENVVPMRARRRA
jgi:integrase